MLFRSCYENYGELVLSFHDTIVGFVLPLASCDEKLTSPAPTSQLFGHMNVDHFTFIGAHDVLPSSDAFVEPTSRANPINPLRSSGSIASTLKESYEALPKRRKAHLEDFSVVNINPSVIPTYLPAVRIWQYNTTVESRWRQPVNVELTSGNATLVAMKDSLDEDEGDDEDLADEPDDVESQPERQTSIFAALAAPLHLVPSSLLSFLLPTHPLFAILSPLKKRKKHHSRKKKKKPRPAPRMPRHFSPDSPSLTNRYLTPIGFTQFYIDLDNANLHSGFGPGEKARRAEKSANLDTPRPAPAWEVEYVSFEAESYAKGLLGRGQAGGPVPLKAMPGVIREMVQDDGEDKVGRIAEALRDAGVVPYELEDLTVGSWVGLARHVVKTKKRWRRFVRKMFVGSGVKG